MHIQGKFIYNLLRYWLIRDLFIVDVERIDKGKNNTAAVWNYLWGFIKQADAFIFHPLENSVPHEIPPSRLYFMPAVIDPFDGLNKRLDAASLDYYLAAFNRISHDQVGKRLDHSRPYIAQFARFDPSKGKQASVLF
jgi:hypothetical protein